MHMDFTLNGTKIHMPINNSNEITEDILKLVLGHCKIVGLCLF